MLSSQRVKHETFKAAFAGVQNALEKKLCVSYSLLTELRRRHVLSQSQMDDIKVCLTIKLTVVWAHLSLLQNRQISIATSNIICDIVNR